MSEYPCTADGCPFSSPVKGGLAVHRKTCTYRLPSMADAFNKREAENEAEEEAQKRRRLRVESDNDEEVRFSTNTWCQAD